MPDDLSFEELARRSKEAQEARPDVPPEDLIFTAAGEQKVQTFDEVNASDEMMRFLCMRISDMPRAAVPGCVRKRCELCNAEVWMSPATLDSYNRLKKKQIACQICVMEEIKKKEGNPDEAPVQPTDKSGPNSA